MPPELTTDWIWREIKYPRWLGIDIAMQSYYKKIQGLTLFITFMLNMDKHIKQQ